MRRGREKSQISEELSEFEMRLSWGGRGGMKKSEAWRGSSKSCLYENESYCRPEHNNKIDTCVENGDNNSLKWPRLLKWGFLMAIDNENAKNCRLLEMADGRALGRTGWEGARKTRKESVHVEWRKEPFYSLQFLFSSFSRLLTRD